MENDLSHIPDVEYNTDRTDLAIPEYGRNVHRMVEYCKTLNDREHRNKVAQSIIDVIGNLNPHLRDTPDFKHKLWDHLFIMSNFELDVDSPYPVPSAETFAGKPDKVEYPNHNYKLRHYGNITRELIAEAIRQPDGERKQELVRQIANQMKRSYLAWNKDTVDDAVILNELNQLAEGRLDLENISLATELAMPHTSQSINNAMRNNKRKKKKQRTKARTNNPGIQRNQKN